MSTACSACGSSSAPAELFMLPHTMVANGLSQQVSDESVCKENIEDCGHGVRLRCKRSLLERVHSMFAFVI